MHVCKHVMLLYSVQCVSIHGASLSLTIGGGASPVGCLNIYISLFLYRHKIVIEVDAVAVIMLRVCVCSVVCVFFPFCLAVLEPI